MHALQRMQIRKNESSIDMRLTVVPRTLIPGDGSFVPSSNTEPVDVINVED